MPESKNKCILAIDCATQTGSVALYNGEKVYVKSNDNHVQKHSDIVLEHIDQLLKQVKISLKNITHLAIGQGPGAFTGIRTAISVAKGIGLATNCPIIPLSNLEVMAHISYQNTNHPHIISLIDARMSELYLGAYHMPKATPLVKPQVISPNQLHTIETLQLKKWHAIGSGVSPYFDTISQQIELTSYDTTQVPQAGTMAKIAWERTHISVSHQALEPLYLRNHIAQPKH